jgi:hypothetical protein
MSSTEQTPTKRHIVTFDVDASIYAALREVADVYGIHASTLIRAAVRRELKNVEANGACAIEAVKVAGKAARPVGTHATKSAYNKLNPSEGIAA